MDVAERLHFHFSLSRIGEGNGNQLQCSRLENPRDGGGWWAAVYGVAQSRTRLKWLSSSSYTWAFPKTLEQASRSWWWTGRPGVLQYMGSQIVGCNWTEDIWRAFQVALVVKNLPVNTGDNAGDVRGTGLIFGLGRSPGEGNGNPLQYSCLENPMDRGIWQATVPRVTKSWTWLRQPSTHKPFEKGFGSELS